MVPLATLLLATILAHTTVVNAQLQLYTAGPNGGFVSDLHDGMEICPDDFPMGINILCNGGSSDSRAKFLLNGEYFRTEKSHPFYMAGDKRGVPNTWEDYPVEAEVRCLLRPGLIQFSASVRFICNADLTPLMAQPASMYFKPAGRYSHDGVELISGMTFCPMAAFGEEIFTVECIGSKESSVAIFRVDGEVVKEDRRRPFYVSKEKWDDHTLPYAWGQFPGQAFKISCELDDGNVDVIFDVVISCHHELAPLSDIKVIPVPGGDMKAATGCVFIDTVHYAPSSGWEEGPDGLTYMGDDEFAKLGQPGDSSVSFVFTPPRTSRYAVVVDMTTSDKSRLNDLFIETPPDGFQIMRAGVSRMVNGWIRVYHNKNGRAAFSSYFDKDAHSVSTAAVLEAGVDHLFAISGRSPMVTVHRIVLFPCEGTGCQRGEWRDRQNICIPGSI